MRVTRRGWAIGATAVGVTVLAFVLTRPGPRAELSKAQVRRFNLLAAQLRRDCPPPAASTSVDRQAVARDVDALIAFARRHPSGYHMEDGVGLYRENLKTDLAQATVWNLNCGEPGQIKRIWVEVRKMSGDYGTLLPAVLESRWNVARSDLAYRCKYAPPGGLPPAGVRAAKRDLATLLRVDRVGAGHLLHQAVHGPWIRSTRRCGIASEVKNAEAAAARIQG